MDKKSIMDKKSRKPLAIFDWRTDFEGLLRLLAKNLYTQTDVLVRELLQNAHDAIVMRAQQDDDAPPGRIDITIDPDSRTISVEDNGVGLDLPDIRTFLSVIAATNKVELEELAHSGRRARGDMIGQFGIGLLAAFVAANQISLTTRKVRTDQAYRWLNDGNPTCSVFETIRSDVGTKVDVKIRDDADLDFFLNEHSVERIIRHYMDFLPIPIHLNRRAEPVNVIRPPWDRPSGEDRAAADKKELRRFLDDRYPDLILEIIPFSFSDPHRANGLLYISGNRVPDIQTGGNMEVLVHRVCVTKRDSIFLPQWAKFVSGIIDSPDLNPNAARDSVVRDEVFIDLQNSLGRTIVERLKEMARDEPKRFSTIVDYHHFHLVGMAIKHDDFFDEVKDLLPFYTNQIDDQLSSSRTNPFPLLMSLRDYREYVGRDSTFNYKTPIYFTASGGATSQFNILANAQKLLILNTSRIFERDFLRKYADRYRSEVELVQLDDTIHTRLFEELSDDESDRIAPLLGDMNMLLSDSNRNIRIEARRFRPKSLPAALIGELVDDEEENHEHWTIAQLAMGDDVSLARQLSRRQTKSTGLTLLINFDNEIVQRLVLIDRRDRDRADSLRALYNGAFLKSEHLLRPYNTSVIHHQFLTFLRANLDKREMLDRAGAEISNLKESMKELMDSQVSESARRADRHVILFMITPFSSEYKTVENAMRLIFELHPYFFEVRLARDYREDSILHKNVKRHIALADGFIADVT